MTVWKYGDDINTDMLFPGKYTYTCGTAEEVIPHLLEDLDPSFSSRVEQGDIIFAGKNFGCGSSREQPVLGLKAVGIMAVVAKSFARIFYRSAINQGLLLIESADAVSSYNKGDIVTINVENGEITINDKNFSFPLIPDEIIAIQNADGLLNYTRKILRDQRGF